MLILCRLFHKGEIRLYFYIRIKKFACFLSTTIQGSMWNIMVVAGGTAVLNDGNIVSLTGQCDAFCPQKGIIYICKRLQPLGTCRNLVEVNGHCFRGLKAHSKDFS